MRQGTWKAQTVVRFGSGGGRARARAIQSPLSAGGDARRLKLNSGRRRSRCGAAPSGPARPFRGRPGRRRAASDEAKARASDEAKARASGRARGWASAGGRRTLAHHAHAAAAAAHGCLAHCAGGTPCPAAQARQRTRQAPAHGPERIGWAPCAARAGRAPAAAVLAQVGGHLGQAVEALLAVRRAVRLRRARLGLKSGGGAKAQPVQHHGPPGTRQALGAGAARPHHVRDANRGLAAAACGAASGPRAP
jgi:hypothetical protein